MPIAGISAQGPLFPLYPPYRRVPRRQVGVACKVCQRGHGIVIDSVAERFHRDSDEIGFPELQGFRTNRAKRTAAGAEKTNQPAKPERWEAVEEQPPDEGALEERKESRHRVLVLAREPFDALQAGLGRNNQVRTQPERSLSHGHTPSGELSGDDRLHHRGFQMTDSAPEQPVQCLGQVPWCTHGEGIQQPRACQPCHIRQPVVGG